MRTVAVFVALTLFALGMGRQTQRMPCVEMVVEGKGSIIIQLRPDQAPKLVNHFLSLVNTGFYDEQLFHRKVDNFVIQGGDPESKKWTPAKARKNPGESGGTKGLGEGGSGKTVPFEINDLVHDKYTVGMALESPMSDTGDSQYFINLKDNHRLNGMYVVFGKVIEGMDVVAKAERGDRITVIKRTRERN